MNKKNLKLIMELIFIFILPIAFMLISVKSEVVNTYDENGNLLTTEKIFDFSEDSILRDYNDNITYKNFIEYNQLFNARSGGLVDVINTYTVHVTADSTSDYIYISIGQPIQFQLDHYYLIQSDINYSSQVQLHIPGVNSSITDNGRYVSSTNNSVYVYLFIRDVVIDNIYHVNVIDLTDMFGSGYEPSYNYFINNYYLGYKEFNFQETISIYSNDILSENYEYNYTWYSKLFNELYGDLQINNNIVLKLITTYIILWVIMFLVWHLLYRFVDFMVHLFDKKE